MKTDEQILLNYMYMNGYTEEDMFDQHTISKVQRSIGFCIHKMRLAARRVVAAFGVVAQKIIAAWDNVVEQVREMMPVLEENSSEKHGIAQYKSFLPINYSERPRIQHQVIDRKPKNLTRKIIR